MNRNQKSLLDRYIPITGWLREYRFSDFKKDARAGLTVGILLIPQSMAYALLAGLPPGLRAVRLHRSAGRLRRFRNLPSTGGGFFLLLYLNYPIVRLP